MGKVRTFTEEAYEALQKGVSNDDFLGRVGDFFSDIPLHIRDAFGDIELEDDMSNFKAYLQDIADLNDYSSQKIFEIFSKVQDVDTEYAKSVTEVQEDIKNYTEKLMKLKEVISVPDGIEHFSGKKFIANVTGNGKSDQETVEGMGEPAIRKEWLNLYANPTVNSPGHTVARHPDANLYDWGMPEELSGDCERGDLTKNARDAYEAAGKVPVVNITPNSLYMDADGRYWVAVGPNVMNPNHKPDEKITPEEMQYGTKIDIVVCKQGDETETKYYIPAVVGDVKANTAPSGLYQTGKGFPGVEDALEHNDGSTVEFMGHNITDKSVNITNNYKIIEIIVYDGVKNYE